MNNELTDIANRASIQFKDDGSTLFLKSKFKLNNKSNIGVIFFLLLSLAFSILFILKGNEWFTIGIGVLLGGSIFVFSILVILKQFTDFTKVTNKEIQFKNSLKSYRFPLDPKMKIRLDAKTEYTKLTSVSGSGSFFRIIEIYLMFEDSEYRIFDYLVPAEYIVEADKLASEIVIGIENKIITS